MSGGEYDEYKKKFVKWLGVDRLADIPQSVIQGKG